MVIVHLGHVPYEGHHHVGLFEAYARRVPTIYLEMGGRSARDAEPGAGRARPGVTGIAPGLERWRVIPPLPGGRLALASRWNWWLATRSVLKGLARRGLRDRVLIVQVPRQLPTLRGLDADLTAYLVVDGYVGLASMREKAAVARAHRRMVREADLVWTISDPLREEAGRHRPDIHLTTTGVDYAAFAAAAAAPPSPEMAAVPAPRIGMVGNLNDRVDWDLAEALASARPAWSFVFVGPLYRASRVTHDAVARLRAHPNVWFLPEVTPEDLPRSIAGLDVGLVLYRPGEGTLGINPLKLYQYLACGRPVVATPLPAFDAFRDVVRVGTVPGEFVAAIEAELAAPDAERLRDKRRRRSLPFDWEQVARDRLALLETRLAARRAGKSA